MNRAIIRSLAHLAVLIAIAGPSTAVLHAQDDTAGTPRQNGERIPGMGRGRGIRGTVVATSGANVTIKAEAGDTWTVFSTDNTRINIDRQPVKIADLKAGDEVGVMGMPDGNKHEIHAMMIAGVSAAQVAKLKANLGKTYIVGKITSIEDTRLTVLRPDKVAQTMALDETTSIKRGGRLPAEFSGMGTGGGFGGGGGGRRGQQGGQPNETSGGNPGSGNDGESITLADVKVGDNVAGLGSIKAGAFTPTELHINTPRPRPASPAGAPAGGPPPQQP